MKLFKQELLNAVQSIPDAAFEQTKKITVSIDKTRVEVTYAPAIPVGIATEDLSTKA